ncbi:Aromatic amino acid exporter YddG [Leclercia adecarboxylata]|uniref:Aromatic amino acid exporter YddG n=1 Tax=Leclercia adecarboxylata TaxID=83655 RepID=A0A4U9HLW8_9ENTR|nr:Aromatic amino acid exporter YddG [Leclercia adecarboxylata]
MARGGSALLLAAMAMGFGYAAWNVGILHGNVTVLAAASYFIPIISAVLAAFMLDSHPDAGFLARDGDGQPRIAYLLVVNAHGCRKTFI